MENKNVVPIKNEMGQVTGKEVYPTNQGIINGGNDRFKHQSALTFGQQLVGLKFNPSNDDTVGLVKQSFAKLADLVYNEPIPTSVDPYVVNLVRGDAFRKIKDACMDSVKFITLKFN